jgi:hypothetical protein
VGILKKKEELCQTLKGERFIKVDSTMGNNKILLFYEPEYVRSILENGNITIFMDETFYATPRFLNKYTYCIHIKEANVIHFSMNF